MLKSPRVVRAVLGALSVLVLSACGEPTGTSCPPDSTLTAANFGTDFMTRYCNRCHAASLSGSARQGAPAGVNFDTLDAVRRQTEDIDRWSGAGPNGENTQMPPSGPIPTSEERRQLSEWLACGAP
ncbi:hypothetical protein [Melittangium boletus]|uniref:hypothetical protein n=1 Tax=Melittangium boletus TaxID=83453 RepID=UPI003DA5A97D